MKKPFEKLSEKTIDVHIRLPDALHKRIVESAAANRRKIVHEILIWLERA